MVEYHIGNVVYITFDRAAGHALSQAASGRDVVVDVVIYSADDAREFGGEDAVERYLEDPDASVFERLKVSVVSQGRVP